MWDYVFSDIDGTLLNKERRLSPKTVKTLLEVKKSSTIVLISSRMPKGMIYFQEELEILDAPLVCYNGGLVLRTGRDYLSPSNIILDLAIAAEITRGIYALVEPFAVNLSIYSYDDWYTFEDDYWTKREVNNTRVHPVFIDGEFLVSNEVPAHKVMVMGAKEDLDLIVAGLSDRYASDLHLYRSKDTYLEVSSAATSKGVAVKFLLGLDAGSPTSVAFGDNFNDVSMFEAVDFGVAVANGRAALIALADETCLSNLEDGVALFLARYYG